MQLSFLNENKEADSGSVAIASHLTPWLVLDNSFLTQPDAHSLMERLIGELPWQQPEVIVFGQSHKIPRLQAWQSDPGVVYQYSGKVLEPEPWHPDVLKIKQRVEQVSGKRFNSVLINYYRSGEDKMGWHADNEPELGANPTVAAVSLGARRDIQFKSKQYPKAVNVALGSGSLLIMKAGMQRHFQHQIPARLREAQARISLTFRHVLPTC